VSNASSLDLFQVLVQVRLTLDDSLHNLLDDAFLVRLDCLFNIGQLGLGSGVDRGLRGGRVRRVLRLASYVIYRYVADAAPLEYIELLRCMKNSE
jgi:hypothetical protein